MRIVNKRDVDEGHVLRFFIEHWGSPEMIVSTGVYQCHKLDGYIMMDDNQMIVGLITFACDHEDEELEIISLDSIVENKGIGTELLQTIEREARNRKCKIIKLITTNDNVKALKFYQKRGYVLSKLMVNAVEKARTYKPEIPLIGNDGIPIRDEIELMKVMD
ncbi:GNAT family N-acetyltransferase [Bacillus salitolerans]|uniref:GNAT family N-acetyltransferase n=1 Tax=Bacillus salitolerans TaxID=1437434 RepID=A0ABW4LK68_9BACI